MEGESEGAGTEKRREGGSFIQLNPAIAYFKGLVKIVLYIEVLFIANI